MKSFLQLKFLPANPGFALFLLRVWLGLSIFVLHGLPKLQKVLNHDYNFGDPIGIGRKGTLFLAVFVEVGCGLCLALGLMGRLAALLLAITMGVAFVQYHHMSLGDPPNGELAYIYLAGFLTIVRAGTGKYGIDRG
ncbi:DoxX family protein [Haloferula sp. BvORR071]|uniref:DoxX family protein n=1 Tax=Haloferula sp. BvORR071 TaxID=1396141 RepID=UPI00054D282A|nr:DoxX family protein [Haloferula sp. BvORR071]